MQGRTLAYPPCTGANILDVADAAHGIVTAIQRGRAGESYLLAGENVTLEALCRMVAQAAGGHAPLKEIPLPLVTLAGWAAEALGVLGWNVDFSLDIRRQSGLYWWVSGKKAEHELGFRPVRNAGTAVERSVAWLRAQGRKF